VFIPLSVVAYFLQQDKMNFVERSLISILKVLTGDFRDQDAIAAWAKEFPGKIEV
jgi:hypothetical protein